MTKRELFYLEDEELARQLVELGYRGNGETLKRDEFEVRKRELEEARSKAKLKAPKVSENICIKQNARNRKAWESIVQEDGVDVGRKGTAPSTISCRFSLIV